MMNHCVTALVLAGMMLLCGSLHAEPPRRPNIIVIMADDLGWSDLGSYGSTFYETPHIDRLAARSMRFTDAYAACQVCSPTRASLLTGRYPARLGITDYLSPNDARNKRQQAIQRNCMLLPAVQREHLDTGVVTFADAFKAAGYQTFFLGKWHVGDPEQGHGPRDHGFDVNIAGTHQGGPYGRGQYFHPFDMPNLPSQPGDQLTERMAEEAVALMESAGDEPFIMYFAFYDVHTPLMTKPTLREKYEAKAATVRHDGPRFAPEPPRQARQVQDHAVYAGMVETMDAAVGTIIAALEALGIDDSTIIIFTSDNGGLSTSEGSPTSNVPLRAGKGWMYEGGIRVPLIVHWPGVTEPGSISDAPVVTADLFPTMLAVAELPLQPEHHCDGINLAPVLRQGPTLQRDAIYWHYPHYGNQGGSPASAIRMNNWKLIEFHEDGRLELYDLASDPGERTNLARKQADRAEAMRRRLAAWRDEVGAKHPEKNPQYDPALGRRD